MPVRVDLLKHTGNETLERTTGEQDSGSIQTNGPLRSHQLLNNYIGQLHVLNTSKLFYLFFLIPLILTKKLVCTLFKLYSLVCLNFH